MQMQGGLWPSSKPWNNQQEEGSISPQWPIVCRWGGTRMGGFSFCSGLLHRVPKFILCIKWSYVRLCKTCTRRAECKKRLCMLGLRVQSLCITAHQKLSSTIIQIVSSIANLRISTKVASCVLAVRHTMNVGIFYRSGEDTGVAITGISKIHAC